MELRWQFSSPFFLALCGYTVILCSPYTAYLTRRCHFSRCYLHFTPQGLAVLELGAVPSHTAVAASHLLLPLICPPTSAHLLLTPTPIPYMGKEPRAGSSTRPAPSRSLPSAQQSAPAAWAQPSCQNLARHLLRWTCLNSSEFGKHRHSFHLLSAQSLPQCHSLTSEMLWEEG